MFCKSILSKYKPKIVIHPQMNIDGSPASSIFIARWTEKDYECSMNLGFRISLEKAEEELNRLIVKRSKVDLYVL